MKRDYMYPDNLANLLQGAPTTTLQLQPWPPRSKREVRNVTLPGASHPLRVYSTSFPGSRLVPDWWVHPESGIWEPSIFKVIAAVQRVRPGLHVDSGSWIGPTALYAALHAPAVLVVEPDPWAFDEVSANFALNDALLSKTQLFRTCLSLEEETLTFFGTGESGSTTNAVVHNASMLSWSVQCFSLQTLLNRALPGERRNLLNKAGKQFLRWSFWKLDVEGAGAFPPPH